MKQIYKISGLLLMSAISSLIPSQAVSAELEGGKMYVYMAASPSIYTYVSNRMYTMTYKTGVQLTPFVASNIGYSNAPDAATWANGKFYALNGNSFYTTDVNQSGDSWENSMKTVTNGNGGATDLTYDSTTDRIYGWFYADSSKNSYTLGTIDVENATITTVGTSTTTALAVIAADDAGRLYGIARDGMLYSISKTDGVLTQIGNTGKTASADSQSACVDPDSGMLYWANYNSDNWFSKGVLYSVNLTTGAASQITELGTGRYVGMYIAPEINPTAPAEIADLAGDNDGTDNDLTITFTIPSQSVNGSKLPSSVNVSYTIQLDGETVATGSGKPGTVVEKKVSSTPGTHTLSAYCALAMAGNGPQKIITVFVGLDTPGSVTGLTLTTDGSDATISWTAPERGVNGGRYDASKVRYRVTRLPENVVVADQLAETTFTDHLSITEPTEVQYTVELLYDGSAVSTAITSKALLGPSFEVTFENPYFQDFQDVTGVAGFLSPSATPLSLGTEGMDSYLRINPDGNRVTNIDVVTPALRLTEKKTYRVSFRHRFKSYYGASTGVRLLDSPLPGANEIKVLNPLTSYVDVTTFSDANTVSLEFTVPTTGTYYLSIFANVLACELDIDDFRVEDLSAPAVPQAVTDFKATPAAVGSRDIRLSFTLPVADTADAPLSMTKVELSRDNETISTWTENLVPGAEMTYDDLQAPVGYHTYSVVVYNAQGASVAARAAADAGFYYDLAFHAVNMPESINHGESEEIDVTVINNGSLRVTEGGYFISFIVDDVVTDFRAGSCLNPGETEDFTFTYRPTDRMLTSATCRCYITYNDDQDDTNNHSGEYVVKLIDPDNVGVEGVNASAFAVRAVAGGLAVSTGSAAAVIVSTDGKTMQTVSPDTANQAVMLVPGTYIVSDGVNAVSVIVSK